MEKGKILIVEDEVVVSIELEDSITKLGHTVSAIVESGEEAVKAVDFYKPSLILMDIRLKGEMDGIEAANQIKKQFDIPVVFLTAFADQDKLDRAKLTTPFGYLLKPVQERDLRITLQMALHTAKIELQKKEAENALRESDKRFKAHFQTTPLPTFIWEKRNDDFILTETNEAAEKLTQGKSPQFIGLSANRIYPDRSDIIQNLNDSLSQQKVIRQETDYQARGTGLDRKIIFTYIFAPPNLVVMQVEDITDQKQAEDRLLFQAQLLDAVDEAVIVTDLLGNVDYWNPYAEKLYGWTIDEAIGKTTIDLISTDESKRHGEEIMQSLQNGNSWSGEYLARHKNGKTFPIISTISPMRDENGELTHLIGISSDISTRKKTAQELQNAYADLELSSHALQESKKQYEELVEAANSIILKLDTSGKVTFINQHGLEYFGFDESELLGRKAIERYLPESDSTGRDHKKMINDILEKPDLFAINENENIRKNGERVWVSWTNKGIRNEKGRIVEILSVGNDITKLKQLEKDLINNQEKLKKAQETAKLGHWELNFMNNYLEWSDEIYRIFELDAKKFEPSYETFLETIHPDDREFVDNSYKESVKNKTGYDIVHRLRLKNGTIKHVREVCSTTYSELGKPVRSLGIVQDVTASVMIENELKKAKFAADNANRAKSDFLANMSHELRTPLNAIIGFTQVLDRQLKRDLNEKQRKYFKYIKEGGDHLLEMVNDILDLAKIESGKIVLDKKPFDLGSVLERSPSLIKSLADKKNLEVVKSIEPDLGWLNGDETKIKQILFNLLSNAVKFTEFGKKIGIDARVTDDLFEVTVWDEGRGIPKEFLDQIFDPFEQVKSVGIKTETGTGLGLAISKRLVELHQGTLTVKSKLGEGSQFTITLPERIFIQSEVDEEEFDDIDQLSTDTLKGVRILVTEDNEPNFRLIESMLNPVGCRLDYAMTGKEAVELSKENTYDLILMDIQLPEIDGVEAMKQIRATNSQSIPMIALTAFAMEGDEEKYLTEGFDDYISKPINIRELINKISKTLSQSK